MIPTVSQSHTDVDLLITQYKDYIMPTPKKHVWVTFQREGIHAYPDAGTNPALATGDWDDVSFLAHPHRHTFTYRVSIEIFHNDRCLEFIQVKRQCLKWLNDGDINVDHKSCEMLAEELYELISKKWPNRDVTIEVGEDGENGCTLQFDKTPN